MPVAAILGDVDGDGDLDLVAGNASGEANRVYINDGAGSFTEANRVYVNDGAGNFTDSGQSLGSSLTQSVTLGDVDGDGDLDLVAGNINTSRVYINLTN